jgi:hypothetical protein
VDTAPAALPLDSATHTPGKPLAADSGRQSTIGRAVRRILLVALALCVTVWTVRANAAESRTHARHAQRRHPRRHFLNIINGEVVRWQDQGRPPLRPPRSAREMHCSRQFN